MKMLQVMFLVSGVNCKVVANRQDGCGWVDLAWGEWSKKHAREFAKDYAERNGYYYTEAK